MRAGREGGGAGEGGVEPPFFQLSLLSTKHATQSAIGLLTESFLGFNVCAHHVCDLKDWTNGF